jgi:hypothetical protein
MVGVHTGLERGGEVPQKRCEVDAFVGVVATNSALWVCYPKANSLGTDLNRDVLRVWLGEKGLTAVAQIAIDDVWSGLRFKLSEAD